MKNRSVPADIVLPHITYQNVAAAAAWLNRVFGFTEHYRYGEKPDGIQMYFGKACFMLNTVRPGRATPRQCAAPGTNQGTQSLTVFVDDVDAHFEKSKAAGAKIVEELNETIYGERQYGVEDLDGHHWLFARHAHDVSPEEWGAILSNPIAGESQ